jgi:23S rRNA (guanosine2251-2'-O)-methyltransferase
MSQPGRRAPEQDDGRTGFVYGVRPVQELLDRRVGEVERLFVAREGARGLGRILRLAREAGIPVTHLTKALLGRKVGRGASHQGIAAQVAERPYRPVEELCRAAEQSAEGLLLLVDRVVDPGNLGAILRTAAAAGAAGVILASGGTAGLTGAVAKASAGAVERVVVAREPRLPALLKRLGERGFATLALDPRGDESWDQVDLRGPVALVLGGEARGARPGVVQACNRVVAIPLAGKLDSLNVAVAAGVLLFERVRQRRASTSGLETSETRC